MSDLPIFPLTSEHKMIRDAARDFAKNEIAPIAAEFDESGEFPSKTIKKMGEMGFMGIEVPKTVRRRRDGYPGLCAGARGNLQGGCRARGHHVGQQLACTATAF
jgi:alkylation response protein AidB-like acyl-CoA dehydrogenase